MARVLLRRCFRERPVWSIPNGARRKFSICAHQLERIESLSSQFVPRNKRTTMEFCNAYTSASPTAQELMLQQMLNVGSQRGDGMLFRNVLEHDDQGVRFLVELRRDLLRLYKSRKKEKGEYVELRNAVSTLSDIMRPLFGQASLDLRRISLESQGALIEKLMEYEQVHPYMGLGDVKRRLGYGYRCFALFHPKLEGEPLVFVHVALVSAIAESMEFIRESRIDEHDARAAIFYTISASEQGLAGFDLGNQLINRVVAQLEQELPQLELFSSLSPVPNFCKWLYSEDAERVELDIKESHLAVLERTRSQLTEKGSSCSSLEKILDVLEGHPQWYRDAELNQALELPLMHLMTQYLMSIRHNRQLPLCPVASFHLQNGAVLRRINWNADLSRKGLDNSAGMMVNYQYILKDLDANMAQVAEGSLSHALTPFA